MHAVHGAELVVVLCAVFVIGALIGGVGIGGLLLAPMLVAVVGLGVREAIAISMASFMATGLAALWLFARDHAPTANRRALVIATMPGALAGALALWVVPERMAVAVLAAFLAVTGGRLLIPRRIHRAATQPASRSADIGLGAATGFLSALTGTGGPMVLVPLLTWRGSPLLAAIALGQIVQLPIAGVATLGNYASGGVDFAAAAAIGLVLVPGVVVGRRTMEMVPVEAVTRLVALVLIAAGAWLGYLSAVASR